MENTISSTTDELSAKTPKQEVPEELTEFLDTEEELEDILDLAGGAKAAIQRHKSEKQNKDTEITAPASESNVTSQLWDLLYWLDVQKSACMFGVTLSLMLTLSLFSVVSVCSYIALSLLSVTISLRIYRGITDALQKTEHVHPFRVYLEQDITLSANVITKHVDVLLIYINTGIRQLKHLFLVEDLIDSLKLVVLLWILTHVGAVFNALSLLIIVDIVAFTCPFIYTKKKIQIDHYCSLVNSHISNGIKKIQEKIHGVKTNKTK